MVYIAYNDLKFTFDDVRNKINKHVIDVYESIFKYRDYITDDFLVQPDILKETIGVRDDLTEPVVKLINTTVFIKNTKEIIENDLGLNIFQSGVGNKTNTSDIYSNLKTECIKALYDKNTDKLEELFLYTQLSDTDKTSALYDACITFWNNNVNEELKVYKVSRDVLLRELKKVVKEKFIFSVTYCMYCILSDLSNAPNFAMVTEAITDDEVDHTVMMYTKKKKYGDRKVVVRILDPNINGGMNVNYLDRLSKLLVIDYNAAEEQEIREKKMFKHVYKVNGGNDTARKMSNKILFMFILLMLMLMLMLSVLVYCSTASSALTNVSKSLLKC